MAARVKTPAARPAGAPVAPAWSLRRALRRLAREHAPAALRAGLVGAWARGAGIAPRALRGSPALAALLDRADLAAAGEVETALAPLAAGLDLKGLERAFEGFLDPAARREQGAVYTPAFVIDHLVEQGLALAGADGAARPPVVCDPACGSGGFLVRAAELLARRSGTPLERVVERQLVGFDLSPAALEQAAALLDLLLLSRGRPARAHRARLLARDTLVTPGDALLGAAGEPRGFALVATNPPYVKLQNLPPPYRRALERRFPALTFGSWALAPLALVAYLELLAPGGCVAAVTQNNLFTSLAGAPVRRLLQERGALRRIVDFGHRRLFADASAYACLLFLGREPRGAVEFAAVAEPSPAGLAGARHAPIPLSALDPRKWRLGSPLEREWVRRIEGAGMPLGEAARIRVGFATLKDAVFFVDGAGGAACTAVGVDGAPVRIEAGLTRPAVKVAAVGSEAELRANTRRVIFPYEKVGARHRLVPEDRLRAEFPRTWRYLCGHREALAARDKGRRTYAAWYAWGRTQGLEAPGPKLLTRTFDSQPRFFLDPTDQLFCNGYALFPRGEADLRVLQALLNSRTLHLYLKLTSFQLDGDYQCYQKNFLERFGIPRLDRAQRARLLALTGEAREAYVAGLYGLPGELLTRTGARGSPAPAAGAAGAAPRRGRGSGPRPPRGGPPA